MSATTHLSPEHKAERQRLAAYHSIQPSKATASRRSRCSQCDTPDIAWVSTDAYLLILSDKEAPQHVLDYPDGEAWVCLECEETGYVGNSVEEDDLAYAEAAQEVRKFNDRMLLSKISDDVLGVDEKALLNELLTSINSEGLHNEYDLIFELASGLSPREFELAGGSISREVKVNSGNPTVLRNMVTLALLAAPIVNAFAPETSSIMQMPLAVKKLGKVLTERWLTDDFGFLDNQRFNYARGLLLRRLLDSEYVGGHGYHEDIYTQWIGMNVEALAERADEVKQHGGLDFDAMTRWLGKNEAKRFIIESEATELASFTSSSQLGYVIEGAELDKSFDAGSLSATDRSLDHSGRYAFTLAQFGYLEWYASTQGYAGRESELPVYKLVEALGLVGVGNGGDGLAEEVILALTAVEPREMEPLVTSAATLNNFQKLKAIEVLDYLMGSIERQESNAEEILSSLSSAFEFDGMMTAV